MRKKREEEEVERGGHEVVVGKKRRSKAAVGSCFLRLFAHLLDHPAFLLSLNDGDLLSDLHPPSRAPTTSSRPPREVAEARASSFKEQRNAERSLLPKIKPAGGGQRRRRPFSLIPSRPSYRRIVPLPPVRTVPAIFWRRSTFI